MSNDAASATQRYFEVMDAPITVSSPTAGAAADRPAAGWSSPASGSGFADTAADAGRPAARHRSDIAPGETVALVGATGSGKTTLTSLVNRLYDVTGGSITLDGVDIRDLDLADLRGQVAVAFEEPTLFSASVRENVLLGRPAGSDEDVLQALRWRRPTSCWTCRGGWTPGSASRASRCPVVNANGWPWPERWSATGGAGAGRPALRAGHPHRGPGGAGAAIGAGRHHRPGGGAPGVHRAAGRPGRPPGRRPDHCGRHPFRIDGRPSPVTGTCWPAGTTSLGRRVASRRGRPKPASAAP